MDGGIRLTEAAKGILFTGPAEKGGGHLTLLPAVLPVLPLFYVSLICLR